MATFSGSFITEGSWTSQTLTNSLGKFPTASYNGHWGLVIFEFETGDPESDIKLDILNSSGSVLLTDITLTEKNNTKQADLSIYPTIRAVDIQLRIRLRAVSKSPVVKNIEISWQDTPSA